LTTSGGDYLCGANLTAADILMSFPLVSAKTRFDSMGKWDRGSFQAAYPTVWEYIERLETAPGFVAATKKMEEIDG
jgi:glutathione S-transferase